jgi:hypothetical protein
MDVPPDAPYQGISTYLSGLTLAMARVAWATVLPFILQCPRKTPIPGDKRRASSRKVRSPLAGYVIFILQGIFSHIFIYFLNIYFFKILLYF